MLTARWHNYLTVLLLFVQIHASIHDTFGEKLQLRQLSDGRVESFFIFDVNVTGTDADILRHYRLLSQSLGQLVKRYDTSYLDVSFTRGRWQYDKWGMPNREKEVGIGAEVTAIFEADQHRGGDAEAHRQDVDGRWDGLTGELAGLFCASLNFIDASRTTAPKWVADNPEQLPSLLRSGYLPGEIVCTENLTPFVKLLPCRDQAGLGSLLDGHTLASADFHNMAITLNKSRGEQGISHIRVQQTLQTVHNPVRASLGRESRGKRDWSLEDLFSKKMQITSRAGAKQTAACPLASTSSIELDVSGRGGVEGAYWSWPKTLQMDGDRLVWNLFEIEQYQIEEDALSPPNAQPQFNLGMRWHEEEFHWPSSFPEQAISFRRHLVGSGGERGGIRFDVQNNAANDYDGSLILTLPWVVRPFIHTLKIHLHEQAAPKDTSFVTQNVLPKITYQPSLDRLRPTTITLAVHVPQKSSLKISLSFEKAFIRYSEYPPDANRGFDIMPSILVAQQSDMDVNAFPRILYTSNSLLDLSTPDFSMCYNVIILSCTVISLIFGSAMNILLRNFELQDPKRNS